MQKKCWTLPDYHLHTWRCGHAAGKMAEYVEAARAAGISEIGFADHVPMYWLPAEKRNPTLAMKEEDLPVYVAEVEKLRKENPDLVIRLGIEADYIPAGRRFWPACFPLTRSTTSSVPSITSTAGSSTTRPK